MASKCFRATPFGPTDRPGGLTLTGKASVYRVSDAVDIDAADATVESAFVTEDGSFTVMRNPVAVLAWGPDC